MASAHFGMAQHFSRDQGKNFSLLSGLLLGSQIVNWMESFSRDVEILDLQPVQLGRKSQWTLSGKNLFTKFLMPQVLQEASRKDTTSLVRSLIP